MSTATLPQAPVTEEEVRQFNREGFLIVEDALPPEKVSALLAAIARLEDDMKASSQRKRVFGLDIRPIVDKHDAFLELIEWPATFPKVVRFLQHYNIQLLTSHLIMVPPKPEKRNIGWHRDGGGPRPTACGEQSRLSLKVGFFLRDLLEPDMGSLMVVPGSHRVPDPIPWRAGEPNPDGAVELRIKAGSAVIFESRLYHAGAINRSQQTRVVLYYGYGYRWLKPIDYEGAMPQAILDRATPIGRQLLGAKDSHLGYFKPTEEDVPLKAWYRDRFGETWLA